MKAHRPHHATVAKWARFWAKQPDLPVILAWAPKALPHAEKQPSQSVVAQCYKDRYATNGTKGKGNGDALWRFTLRFLDGEGKLDVAAWEAFLTENGVRHEAWKRTGNGWQGRLRMSGSVVLRGILKRGEAVFYNGEMVAL